MAGEGDSSVGTVRGESWWKLKNTQIDTFSKFFSMAGVVGAVIVAVIAFKNYLNQSEESDRNASILDMHFSTEVVKIPKPKYSLVYVNIELINKGKRPIYPYAHTDDPCGEPTYTGEGLTLSVTKHGLPTGDSALPEDGAGDLRVISRYNILEKKYSYNNGTSWDKIYSLKPNLTYKETEVLQLARGALYEIRIRFYGSGRDARGERYTWTNTETKFLYLD